MRRLRKLGGMNSGNEKSDESPANAANNHHHQETAEGSITNNNLSTNVVGFMKDDNKNVVILSGRYATLVVIFLIAR
jgi:hypothetical protein